MHRLGSAWGLRLGWCLWLLGGARGGALRSTRASWISTSCGFTVPLFSARLRGERCSGGSKCWHGSRWPDPIGRGQIWIAGWGLVLAGYGHSAVRLVTVTALPLRP